MKIGTKNNKMLDFDGDNFVPNIFFKLIYKIIVRLFFYRQGGRGQERDERDWRETLSTKYWMSPDPFAELRTPGKAVTDSMGEADLNVLY